MGKNETTQVRVGKIDFASTTLSDATSIVIREIANKTPIPIRLSNAYCVALASEDPRYAKLFRDAGHTFPDGSPVVWFMRRRLKSKVPGRVRGPSLFHSVMKQTQSTPIRHFYLGSTDATLTALGISINSRYPDLQIAGMYSPPFTAPDSKFIEACAVQVEESNADVVWIALGTPKQDFVASLLAARVGMPCVAVGAAFDFTAGTVKEAPVWMQRSGLEWSYRLATEPKRLWRRYLIGNLRFLYSASMESSR